MSRHPVERERGSAGLLGRERGSDDPLGRESE